jgi:hypothetical protein
LLFGRSAREDDVEKFIAAVSSMALAAGISAFEFRRAIAEKELHAPAGRVGRWLERFEGHARLA